MPSIGIRRIRRTTPQIKHQPTGGSQPAGASSNPSKSNAGVTMQPTSVQPRAAAPPAKRRPGRPPGRRAARDVPTEPMDGDRRVALGPDPQLERIASRVLPDLVGIEPMPVRPLAGRQQVEDRAARRPAHRPAAVARHVSTYQPPSGCALHPQRRADLSCAGHALRERNAATANPAATARPTSLFDSAWASGRRSFASRVRMAPAANASMRAMTSPDAVARRP